MARPYRIQFEGAFTYVSVQGTPRRKLFRDRADHARMVEMLHNAAGKHDVTVHAFCATDNQVELVVETPRANSSAFLQGFQTGYTQYYRRRYRTRGPLVRDRFKSKIVEAPLYLLPLTRHIHLLPLQEKNAGKLSPAGKRKLLRTHHASSYGSYTGEGAACDFVETAAALKHLPGPKSKRARNYRDYVEAAITEPDKAFETAFRKSPLAIGPEVFIEKIKADHARFVAGRKPSHFKVYGRKQAGLSRNTVLDLVAKDMGADRSIFFVQKKNVYYRPVASFMLYRHSRMSQDDIAAFLKMSSGAAVSIQIRRLRKVMEGDSALRKQVEHIDRKLGKQ